MVVETRVNNAAYERLALLEPDRKWELRDGYLREKPGMTLPGISKPTTSSVIARIV